MKRLWMSALLMITVALLSAAVVAAAPGPPPPNELEVGTFARIVPAGDPPSVFWKWELPDMSTNPGFQYVLLEQDPACPSCNPPIHWHDDDIVARPASPPSSHNMMQVAPYLEDEPAPRRLSYFMAVNSVNGIDDIAEAYFKVYHPDGSLKYQIHGTATQGPVVAGNPLVPFAGYYKGVMYGCDALGTPTEVGKPLEAAIHSGQMDSATATALYENVCVKKQTLIFRTEEELSKHQPAGEYKVEATAVDQRGGTFTLTNWFDVLAIIGLRIDFNQVQFGTLVPNTAKWVRGDYIFNTTGDSILPTVKNVGNTNMFLGISFDRMIGQGTEKKIIDIFDAQLGVRYSGVERIQVIPPWQALAGANNPEKCFGELPMGSNVLGQLDLSVHPGYVPAEQYEGDLDLMALVSCTPTGQ